MPTGIPSTCSGRGFNLWADPDVGVDALSCAGKCRCSTHKSIRARTQKHVLLHPAPHELRGTVRVPLCVVAVTPLSQPRNTLLLTEECARAADNPP